MLCQWQVCVFLSHVQYDDAGSLLHLRYARFTLAGWSKYSLNCALGQITDDNNASAVLWLFMKGYTMSLPYSPEHGNKREQIPYLDLTWSRSYIQCGAPVSVCWMLLTTNKWGERAEGRSRVFVPSFQLAPD